MAISFEKHKPNVDDLTQGQALVVDPGSTNIDVNDPIVLDKDLDQDFLQYLEDEGWTNSDIRKLERQWKKNYEDLDLMYSGMLDYFKTNYNDPDDDFVEALDALLQNNYSGKYQDFYDKNHNDYMALLGKMDALDGETSVMAQLHTKFELANLQQDIVNGTTTTKFSVIADRQIDIITAEPSRLTGAEMAEVGVTYGNLNMAVNSVDVDDQTVNKDIINILNRSKKLKKVVYAAMDNSDLKKRHFGINLGMNGLAGLVFAFDQKIDVYDDDLNKLGLSWSDLNTDDYEDGNDLKRIRTANGRLFYSRNGGVDNERKKVLKILKEAYGDDDLKKELLEFAYLVKDSGFVWKQSLKQNYNWQSNIDNQQIDASNVLMALCNYNGDRVLSANYFKDRAGGRGMTKQDFKDQYPNDRRQRRKTYKADIKSGRGDQVRRGGTRDLMNGGVDQGDIGTIFGPQLFFAMVRAENELDAKIENSEIFEQEMKEKYLDDASSTETLTGENILIFNILKTVKLINTNPFLDDKIDEYLDPDSVVDNCTQESLFNLTKEFTEFQSLFASAIAKLNGGKDYVRFNLHDNLTGNLDNRLNTEPSPYVQVQQVVEDYLDSPEGRRLKSQLEGNGVDVKSALFFKVWEMFGHMEFQTTETGQMGTINQFFMSGEPLTMWSKGEVVEKIVRMMLGAIASYDRDTGSFTIGPSFFGQMENYKWSVDGKFRVGFTFQKDMNVWNSIKQSGIEVMRGGNIARTVNYGSVISTRFDNIGSLGDGGTLNKVGYHSYTGGKVVLGESVELGFQRGMFMDFSYEKAIELWHHQLDDVLTAVTSLNDLETTEFSLDEDVNVDFSSLQSMKDSIASDTDLKNYVNARKNLMLETFKTTRKGGKDFYDFMVNNDSYINSAIDLMLSTVEDNDIFDKFGQATTTLTQDDKVNVIDNMFRDMRSGIVEESRQSALMTLHNTLKVTQLGAGIATPGFEIAWADAFSFQSWKDKIKVFAQAPLSNIWNFVRDLDLFYVNGRVSSYFNYYMPNATQKYLVMEDVRTGGRAIEFEPDGDLDAAAAAFQGMLTYPGYGDLYNIPGQEEDLILVTAVNDKFEIKINPKYSNFQLEDVLDARVLYDQDKMKNVAWKDDGTLVVGNVGLTDIECVEDGQKVSYLLVFGQKGTQFNGVDNTVRIGQGFNEDGVNDIESISATGAVERNSAKFKTEIVDDITGTGKDKAKKIMTELVDNHSFLGTGGVLADIDGETIFIDVENYTINFDDDGETLTTGTLFVEVEGNEITIDYDQATPASNPDNKLFFDYTETVVKKDWTWDDIDNQILKGAASEFDDAGNEDQYNLVKSVFEGINSDGEIDVTDRTINSVVFDFDSGVPDKVEDGTYIFTKESDGSITVTRDDTGDGLKIEYREDVVQNPRTKATIESEIVSDFSNNSAKDFVRKIIDNDAKLIDPGDGTVSFVPATLEGKQLTDGNLVIKEDPANPGTFQVTYTETNSTPGGDLSIHYESLGGGTSTVTETFDVNNPFCVFDGDLEGALDLLRTNQTKLQEAENYEAGVYDWDQGSSYYKTFMRSSLKITATNGEIDDEELDNAIDALGDIINQVDPGSSDADMNSLRGLLVNGSMEVKMFIVDRCRAIFSLEPGLDNMTIKWIVDNQHGGATNHYMNLSGPAGDPYPAVGPLRDGLTSQVDYTSVMSSLHGNMQPADNVFAYSASYRGSYGRGYGMLPPGFVNILSPNLVLDDELTQDEQEKIRDWFISNFKANKYERELFCKQLEKQLGVTSPDGTTITSDPSNGNDILRQLLTGQTVDVSVDNELKKVTLDLSWMFFLQGECANESMGFRLNGMTVETETPDPVTDNGQGINSTGTIIESDQPDEDYLDATADAVPPQAAMMSFYHGTGVVSNVLHTDRSDLDWKHVMKVDDIPGSHNPGVNGDPGNHNTGVETDTPSSSHNPGGDNGGDGDDVDNPFWF